MSKLDFTPEGLNEHLSTYGGDHHLACSMLKQSADEIDVALMALGDDGEPAVHVLLTAIAQRMRFAADVAEQHEGPTQALEAAE